MKRLRVLSKPIELCLLPHTGMLSLVLTTLLIAVILGSPAVQLTKIPLNVERGKGTDASLCEANVSDVLGLII